MHFSWSASGEVGASGLDRGVRSMTVHSPSAKSRQLAFIAELARTIKANENEKKGMNSLYLQKFKNKREIYIVLILKTK